MIFRSFGIAPRETQQDHHKQRGLRVVLPLPEGLEREIGTLHQEGNRFVFRYAETYSGDPLRAFPELRREYRSEVLWPFFAVRIPSLKRPEVQAFVSKHEISENDTMTLLERLGSRAVSSPFELRRLGT